VAEVPVDQPLNTLGLDSLMAYELREEIKQSIHVDVSLEVFLQDVTLADLSVMLTEQFTEQANKEGASQNLFPPASENEEGLIEGAI
jgi:acyl carrier protein